MSTQQIALLHGQNRYHYARSGTVVHIVNGTLRLNHPPRWQGERMQAHAFLLQAGSVYVLPVSGWYCLDAERKVQLTLCTPEHTPKSFMNFFRYLRVSKIVIP